MNTQLEVVVYELQQAAANDDAAACESALVRIAAVMSSQFGHRDTGLAFRKALDKVHLGMGDYKECIAEIENSSLHIEVDLDSVL